MSESSGRLVDLSLEIDNPILIHPCRTCRMRLFAIPYPLRQGCWRRRFDGFPAIPPGLLGDRSSDRRVRVDGGTVAGEKVVRLAIGVKGEGRSQIWQGERHVPGSIDQLVRNLEGRMREARWE